MMATTHALAGAVVAVAVTLFAPDLAPVAVAAALAGGVFPDLDLYADHRRTLHFPVYYWIPAALAASLAAFVTNPAAVAIASFTVAAALHATMDVLGGGLELRPWLGTSERAVYDHYRGHWIRPRRWVRYDGSPADFLLGAVFAVPVLAVVEGTLQVIVLGAVGISGVYALVRKQLPNLAETIANSVPEPFVSYVPERFVDG